MSRESEKAFNEFHKYLKEQGLEGLPQDQLDVMARLFFEKYSRERRDTMTEETAKTAEDWLDLAENADTDEEMLRYARKALKLDPEDPDAQRMVIQYGDLEIHEKLKALKQAVAKGTEILKQDGLLDENGTEDFWSVLKTRPYMRLRKAYMDALTDLGMLTRAIEEGTEMLSLWKGDNLQIRYTLMHLYAQMEKPEEAMELFRQFGSPEETQMLLPLSILYYKREDWAQAEDCLRRLQKVNPDTRRFIQAIRNGTVQEHFAAMSETGYRSGTMDEFLMELYGNPFLFTNAEEYFEWAHQTLRKTRK